MLPKTHVSSLKNFTAHLDLNSLEIYSHTRCIQVTVGLYINVTRWASLHTERSFLLHSERREKDAGLRGLDGEQPVERFNPIKAVRSQLLVMAYGTRKSQGRFTFMREHSVFGTTPITVGSNAFRDSYKEHTDSKPFCWNSSCNCHEDHDALSQVNQYIQDGLLTPEEATNLVNGKTI